MTDHATIARANAIELEVKKDGLAQKQSGDWTLRFTVQSVDMDERVTRAPMGTRFVCVLVEINDDETPKEVVPTAERAISPVDTPPRSAPATSGGAKRSWDDLTPAQQAGILCNETEFHHFLVETFAEPMPRTPEEAAEFVRWHCGVKSRAKIEEGPDSLAKWRDLVTDYRAWQRGLSGVL